MSSGPKQKKLKESEPGFFAELKAKTTGLLRPKSLPNLEENLVKPEPVQSQAFDSGGKIETASSPETLKDIYEAALKSGNNQDIAYYGSMVAIDASLDKTKIGILLEVGKAHLNLEQFSKALEVFNKVLDLESKNFSANFYKCKILCGLGRYKEAIAAVKEAKEQMGFKRDDYGIKQWEIIAQAFVGSSNSKSSPWLTPRSPEEEFSSVVDELSSAEALEQGTNPDEIRQMENNFRDILALDTARAGAPIVEEVSEVSGTRRQRSS